MAIRDSRLAYLVLFVCYSVKEINTHLSKTKRSSSPKFYTLVPET